MDPWYLLAPKIALPSINGTFPREHPKTRVIDKRRMRISRGSAYRRGLLLCLVDPRVSSIPWLLKKLLYLSSMAACPQKNKRQINETGSGTGQWMFSGWNGDQSKLREVIQGPLTRLSARTATSHRDYLHHRKIFQCNFPGKLLNVPLKIRARK